MPPTTRPPAAATDSVRALLERCAAGDGQAWHELVERYQRLVFGIARGEGLSVEDAADVTQSTFEVLLDRVGDLREPDRLAAWLATVTRRAAWRMRTRRNQERDTGMAPGPQPLPDLPLADEPNDQLERSLWLYEALQELGEPCRSLVASLYFDPTVPSYAEIALRMGRPVGSIGPTRARCLDHLRALLDDGVEAV